MRGSRPLKSSSGTNISSKNTRADPRDSQLGFSMNTQSNNNIRSQNEMLQMNKSLIDKRGSDFNASSSTHKKKIINNKNLELNQPNGVQEEFIQNLQKQIYYLELEMKLMKDREIDTKNKVGGYEILFRDGVPLNEHFLALKTKYTNEKNAFETMVENMKNDIMRIENNNEDLKEDIDRTNKSYYDMIESFTKNSEFYEKKINDLNSKLINETNTIDLYNVEKAILAKDLHNYSSKNIQFKRTIEKEKLFKENKEEKKKKIHDKNIEKFEEIDKLVAKSLLEEEEIIRKIEGNQKLKILEADNTQMIFQINKVERDVHLATAKISELESIKQLQHKYLLDEELVLRLQLMENVKLNEELDNLTKMNEEALKKKVKENEKNQIILINNKIKNQEFEMNYLLEKYKDEEAKAKDLLEEKNTLQAKVLALNEDISNQQGKEKELKLSLVEVRNSINELEIMIEENTAIDETITAENAKLKVANAKLEEDIQELVVKIDELNQKIELNTILNDIDLNELKLLTQNNAMVNSSINSLMGKWDKVNQKLQEIEGKKGQKKSDF